MPALPVPNVYDRIIYIIYKCIFIALHGSLDIIILGMGVLRSNFILLAMDQGPKQL